MRRQVGRIVAAVVVAGTVVVGCGTGPSQVGSAVIIGSDSISLTTVQERIMFALGPEKAQVVEGRNVGFGGGYGPAEVAREIVTDAILHELLAERAAVEGLVVTDVDVDAEATRRDVEQSSLYTDEALRSEVRDDLLAAELGARYIDRLGISYDLVGILTEAEALAAAEIVVAGGPGADAVFADAPPELRISESVLAAQVPSLAVSPLFGSPEGSVILLPPQQDGQPWRIYRITERNTDLIPGGPSSIDQLSPQDLALVGYRLLQEASTEAGIRVNPRYGVWDPFLLRVIDEDMLMGRILPPAAPAAG